MNWHIALIWEGFMIHRVSITYAIAIHTLVLVLCMLSCVVYRLSWLKLKEFLVKSRRANPKQTIRCGKERHVH